MFVCMCLLTYSLPCEGQTNPTDGSNNNKQLTSNNNKENDDGNDLRNTTDTHSLTHTHTQREIFASSVVVNPKTIHAKHD